MTTASLRRTEIADAAIDSHPVLARWAHTGELSITYDQLSDSLTIHRFGRPVPSLVEPVGDVVSRLVSLEDETAETGVLIESFLAVAVPQRPWLSPIAKLLKLPERSPGDFSLQIPLGGTTEATEQVEPDEQWLRPTFAAITRLLSDLAEQGEYRSTR